MQLTYSLTESFSFLLIGSTWLLTLYFPVVSLDQVDDLCRKVYFPIEPVSLGQVSLLSVMLYVLLLEIREYPHIATGLAPEDISTCLQSCETNFQVGLESSEVHTSPTYEHCLLLSMVVSGFLALSC